MTNTGQTSATMEMKKSSKNSFLKSLVFLKWYRKLKDKCNGKSTEQEGDAPKLKEKIRDESKKPCDENKKPCDEIQNPCETKNEYDSDTISKTLDSHLKGKSDKVTNEKIRKKTNNDTKDKCNEEPKESDTLELDEPRDRIQKPRKVIKKTRDEIKNDYDWDKKPEKSDSQLSNRVQKGSSNKSLNKAPKKKTFNNANEKCEEKNKKSNVSVLVTNSTHNAIKKTCDVIKESGDEKNYDWGSKPERNKSHSSNDSGFDDKSEQSSDENNMLNESSNVDDEVIEKEVGEKLMTLKICEETSSSVKSDEKVFEGEVTVQIEEKLKNLNIGEAKTPSLVEIDGKVANKVSKDSKAEKKKKIKTVLVPRAPMRNKQYVPSTQPYNTEVNRQTHHSGGSVVYDRNVNNATSTAVYGIYDDKQAITDAHSSDASVMAPRTDGLQKTSYDLFSWAQNTFELLEPQGMANVFSSDGPQNMYTSSTAHPYSSESFELPIVSQSTINDVFANLSPISKECLNAALDKLEFVENIDDINNLNNYNILSANDSSEPLNGAMYSEIGNLETPQYAQTQNLEYNIPIENIPLPNDSSEPLNGAIYSEIGNLETPQYSQIQNLECNIPIENIPPPNDSSEPLDDTMYSEIINLETPQYSQTQNLEYNIPIENIPPPNDSSEPLNGAIYSEIGNLETPQYSQTQNLEYNIPIENIPPPNDSSEPLNGAIYSEIGNLETPQYSQTQNLEYKPIENILPANDSSEPLNVPMCFEAGNTDTSQSALTHTPSYNSPVWSNSFRTPENTVFLTPPRSIEALSPFPPSHSSIGSQLFIDSSPGSSQDILSVTKVQSSVDQKRSNNNRQRLNSNGPNIPTTTLPQFKNMQKKLLVDLDCCDPTRAKCRDIFQKHIDALNEKERKNLCWIVAMELEVEKAYICLHWILDSFSQISNPQNPMNKTETSAKENFLYALMYRICEKFMGKLETANQWIFVGSSGLNLIIRAALKCTDRPVLTRLLAECAKEVASKRLNKKEPIFQEIDSNGDNLVTLLARKGDATAPILREILDRENTLFDVNYTNTEGVNGLHIACMQHSPSLPSLKVVHVLLKHGGADIKKLSYSGDTALHMAVSSATCHLDLILVIFKHFDQKTYWKELATYLNTSKKSPLEYAKDASNTRNSYPSDVFNFLKKCKHNPSVESKSETNTSN